MSTAAIYLSETVSIGNGSVLDSDFPESPFAVTFEDDGETGYLYAMDLRLEEHSVVDALHIYDVDDVEDKDIPSLFEVVWSGDRKKALLLINKYPHAAFNFEEKRGMCRNNFPEPVGAWGQRSHAWVEELVDEWIN